MDGDKPHRWTVALSRFGNALSRARVEIDAAHAPSPSPLAPVRDPRTRDGHGHATDPSLPEVLLVRARPREVACELPVRVVVPGEVAGLLAAPAARSIGGLILDLTERTRALVDLVREIDHAGLSGHIPLIVIAAAGESPPAAALAWATVPCAPGAEAIAEERALRMCEALAAAEPSHDAMRRTREALGALHGRLASNATEATTREAMLVHDLRSPLGVVKGVLAILTDPDEAPGTPEEDRSLLDLVARATTELEQVIDKLETLYACAGEPTRSERVELAALARGVVEGLRYAPAARGKVLSVRASADHWLVADRQDIVRLLGNLVGNALRHGRGVVEVEIDGDDTDVRIFVRDDGQGIPPAMMGRLFDRFVRDRSAGRMGLGLAIVQRLVERYRGSVTAYNRADREGAGVRGACFVVRLPKVPEA